MATPPGKSPVKVTDTPPQTSRKPKSVEALYIKEGFTTKEVFGVPIKIQQIGGDRWTNIAEKCTGPSGQVLFSVYCREMINACVIEPKLVFEKLNPGAITLLVSVIEDVQGVSEVARKNLIGK